MSKPFLPEAAYKVVTVIGALLTPTLSFGVALK